MSKNFDHIIHKNSSVLTNGNPKLPTSGQIEYGELAVNYAKDKETISLKNANNEIVTFSSDTQINALLEGKQDVLTAGDNITITNNVIAANVPNSLRMMGVTPQTHTLADNADNYYEGQLETDQVGGWFISYSNGSLTVKPTTETDEDGKIKLNIGWQSRLNYEGMIWANVSDILIVYKTANGTFYKIVPMNEVYVTLSQFEESEHITATALVDLDSRINSSESVTEEIQSDIEELEHAVSAALNDLNNRVGSTTEEIENDIEQIDIIVSSALVDLNERMQELRDEFDESDELTAQALTDLDSRIGNVNSDMEEIELGVASALIDLNTNYTNLRQGVIDDEYVISSALNDLNKRITETNSDITELGSVVDEIDEITASALNDLDTRVTTLENAPGGSGGDVNVIETVKVNGTALVPDANKAVDVTVPTETTVSGWGFTKNAGTITGITMNGASKGTSGVVNLGTVITSHQDISGKADKSAAIGSLSLSLNSTNYQITLSGTKVDGTSFTVSNVIDLPLESVVVSGSYNDSTKKVVLTLQNGSTVDFSVADLVAGLQSEITSTNKLSADLISDGTTNKTVTATEKNTWNGKQDALSNATVLSGITSTKVSNWDSAATNSHTHSNKTVLDGISSTDISNWNSKTDNVGTVTGVKMNGTTNNPTNGVVDLGTVITSETALSKGTTSGSGNAVTDISVSGHQITLTKGTTFLTSHQDIKTLNGTALTGTGNITLTGVPAFTSADNGKILGVVNGQLAWVTPTTIYTGSGTPSSSQGNDGDIYLQTN